MSETVFVVQESDEGSGPAVIRLHFVCDEVLAA